MKDQITKDERTISGLVIDDNQRAYDWNPTVGNNGITKIVAYDEAGEMAYVPWFAIYADDNLVRRVNGKYVVEISYTKG
jgi:hypothetical protein